MPHVVLCHSDEDLVYANVENEMPVFFILVIYICLCVLVSRVPGIPLVYGRVPYEYGGVFILMIQFQPPPSGTFSILRLRVPRKVVRLTKKYMQ